MTDLPLPMYTVKEAEVLAGLRHNTFDFYARKGQLEKVKDICGQWRVPYHTLVRFVNEKEAGRIKVGR